MATREHRNWEFGKVSALCRIIEVKCSGLCFCEKFISAKHSEFDKTQPRLVDNVQLDSLLPGVNSYWNCLTNAELPTQHDFEI